MSWFLAFAGFAALIILHEFGHFIAAKSVGMRAERFFLFFPPKLFSVKRGETEYGIGMIPLGGFVKITGMNPDEEIPPEVQPRAYYKQPVWKRIVVIFAGPFMNFLIAFLIFFFLWFGAQSVTQNVGEIEEGAPAAGLIQPDDRIVSINGEEFASLGTEERLAEFGEIVAAQSCDVERPFDGCRASHPVVIEIERNGSPQELKIYPKYDAELERMRLGFAYGREDVDPSIAEAAGGSVDFMWYVTTETVGTIAQIFKAEKREELGSVVGGYEATRQAINLDAERAWLLLGVISLSLAIINLFPFLPLDGGHIFWALAEKLRGGRPIPFQVMEKASIIGFVLVLCLFAIGLTNDIGRLSSGEGFGVR